MSNPTATEPLGSATAAARTKQAGSGLFGLLANLLFWGLVLGLIGFNGWWAWRRWQRDRVELVPLESLEARLRQEVTSNDRLLRTSGVDAVREALPKSKAIPEVKKHLVVSPNNGEARRKLARLYAAYQNPLLCAKELHKVPIWWPTKREDQFREGQWFMAANQGRSAEAALLACIKRDLLHPTPPEILSGAHQKLIELYVTEVRLDDARRVIWDAYDQASPRERETILGMLMRLELERISAESRVTVLLKMVAADPGDLEARRALATAEQASGHEAEAEEQIQICLNMKPEDVGVWRDWLVMLQDRGDKKGLFAAIGRLPAGFETDPRIVHAKGVAFEKQGKLAEAAGQYRAALELKPWEPEYIYRLAMVEQRLGKTEAAEKHRAESAAIRDAYGKLADAYQEYAKVSKSEKKDPVEVARAIDRLAGLCKAMGLERASNAWLSLKPAAAMVQRGGAGAG